MRFANTQIQIKNGNEKTSVLHKIREALDNDTLSDERWKSFQKLTAEVRHALKRQNNVIGKQVRKISKKNNIYVRNKSYRFKEDQS